jgi:hypothetical protein
MIRPIAWLLSTCLLAACATQPEILTNTDPRADLDSFRTFGFFDPLGVDAGRDSRSILSAQLEHAMRREMEQRGLQEADRPDVLIDFLVTKERRTDVRNSTNNTVSRSHWGTSVSMWAPAPTHTVVRHYKKGTLIVDLIDTRRNRLLAEGGAQNRIESTRFSQEQVDEVVRTLMARIWPLP